MTNKLPSVYLAALLGVAMSTAVDARVYRCTDAAGKISYSQVPCPADTKSDTMRLGNKERQDKDLCKLARDLAITSYEDMRTGSDPGAVMDEYGGVDYITPATLAVINFAAGFRYNDDLSSQRVGAMAFARCREGGFGQLSEGDLPEPKHEPRPELELESDPAPGGYPIDPGRISGQN